MSIFQIYSINPSPSERVRLQKNINLKYTRFERLM
jgi:hypothetical protein